MTEIKIFVDVDEKTSGRLVICPENIRKLGLKNGDTVEIVNQENKKKTTAVIQESDLILDFAGQFSKNILVAVDFDGVELTVKPLAGVAQLTTPLPKKAKKVKSKKSAGKAPSAPVFQPPPKPQPAPLNEPIPIPSPLQPTSPLPAPAPKFKPTPVPQFQPSTTSIPPEPRQSQFTTPVPQFKPAPTQYQAPAPIPPPAPTQYQAPAPTPPPAPTQYQAPAPVQFQPPPSIPPAPTRPQSVPQATSAGAYATPIDINMLKQQKNGIILNPVVDPSLRGGRVQINPSVLQSLGLAQDMLIAWEDPSTRAKGSARVDAVAINMSEIRMSIDTKQDTNIQSPQIVVYSTETSLQKASQVTLEVRSQPNLMGYCQVGPNVQYTLSLQQNDVLQFSDDLTGATGACRVQIIDSIQGNIIVIDSEILEASGIGSFEVGVSKNQRQIIPLQSVSLGLTPISGENMWQIISIARTNIEPLKAWLQRHIIFKGIKLRWKEANVACSIVSCVPDLTGDVLAQITPNTTLELAPVGLIPFNAILILDISRSMMARDVLVSNIAPAIEGIKAAMESREVQEFLVHFKEGVNIPRRISAAFAAVLFLSEKVGRGFGEKVSVIRFADEAQVLSFGNNFFMDSASGKKGILEEAARVVVDRIGNAYGQATNMGQAMVAARQILGEFDKMNPNQPTMIVLLTDGVPTDGDAFFNEIRKFSANPNVVIYVIGLGNPDDDLMTRAAALCGGEYYKPENAGDLLIWYSKRARDLTVKLKAHGQ
ncbi:MAG: VWA domain-containing protein [Candidatus Lokiarchaeota archaeon]|nr:VWA domain-containing protein [Candidatus Lokiarchaeota archaeon]